MCIIVDTNTLASVFKISAIQHPEFKPVRDWIVQGDGSVIYGGTKYIKELQKAKYLDLFVELRIVNKAKKIDDGIVDSKQAWVESKIVHKDFDDPHLVSLLIVSGCKLICSLDKSAYPFFTHSTYFSPSAKKPKIYGGLRNLSLLSNRNIADICKPVSKLTVKQKKKLSNL